MSNTFRRFVSGAVQTAIWKSDPSTTQAQIVPQSEALPLVFRSLFYVKKTKVLESHKWLTVPADAFILDLEDSVAAGDKARVRREIQSVLPTLPGPQKVLIRLNNPSNSPRDWVEDLRTAHPRLLGFIVPKASVEDVVACDHALDAVESERGLESRSLKLFPMLENARGIEDAACIARASRRNAALMLGRYDLQRSLGCSQESPVLELAYQEVVLAARGAGLLAIGSVNCDLKNHNLYEEECRRYFETGFSGRSVLTSAQAVIANREFTVADDTSNVSEAAKFLANGNTLQVTQKKSLFGPPHLKRAKDLRAIFEAQASFDRLKSSDAKAKTTHPILLSPREGVDIRVGKWKHSPFCASFTEGLLSIWEQNFIANSTLTSPLHIDKVWGLGETAHVPFSLLFNMAMSLSVIVFSYPAKAHLELVATRQVRPIKVGEKLGNRVRLLSVENKPNLGQIAVSEHQLIDSSDTPVFTVIKKTLFPENTFAEAESIVISEASLVNPLESEIDDASPSVSLVPSKPLNERELYVHELVKAFGPHDAVTLSYLLKGVNPLHVNSHQFSKTELLLSGPCVVAGVIANTALDFGDVLSDQLLSVTQLNKTNNGDVISTVSKVVRVEDVGKDKEKVTLRILGMRNMSPTQLAATPLPDELFDEEMRPAQAEKICEARCPSLFHRIVVHGTRTFLRIKPL
ncbi:unnamed protein product, partial [Mesorhabditis belari]|uniref:HpcH/HpaI aldolase/citrate lyase domain-containing protein n=1 Tax=Mesorhabditis belari TaxID=2138241 RepID=A0AAF3ELV5_9BILA